jgi:hypothetical protein
MIHLTDRLVRSIDRRNIDQSASKSRKSALKSRSEKNGRPAEVRTSNSSDNWKKMRSAMKSGKLKKISRDEQLRREMNQCSDNRQNRELDCVSKDQPTDYRPAMSGELGTAIFTSRLQTSLISLNKIIG